MAAVGEITDIVVVEAPISQRYRELSESEHRQYVPTTFVQLRDIHFQSFTVLNALFVSSSH